MKGVIDETAKKMNAITIQRGIKLDLPFVMPLKSRDMNTASEWLEVASNTSTLVSFVKFFYILRLYKL